MPTNEGNLDRALRVIAGAGILSLAFIGPQSAWGYVGLVPLITGLVGYCPLYSVFKFRTNHQDQPTGA